MRAFGALVAIFSVALSTSAAPVIAGGDTGISDIDISGRGVNVGAITGAFTDVTNKIKASNIANHNVEQSQSHRRDINAGAITNVVTDVMNGVHADNIANHNVKQTQRDLGVGAITEAATKAASAVGADNIGNTNVHQSQRRDEISLATIVVDVTAKLTSIHKRLIAVVAGKVDIDVNIVIPLLHEVEVVLSDAVANIKIVIANPSRAVLILHGKVISCAEFAKMIAVVVHFVCAIITVSFEAVGVAKVYLITNVATVICGHLSIILSSSISVVAGLLVAVRPHIEDVIVTITGVKVFGAVAVVLKLN
ncbi:hypothetical protein AX15_003183 [Amanita polypyramis BW_CC]|nr:hypothetical protein AX15_003183 [Amanita polypyramis BW_CC]